ncbi:MAG: hypothetical protein HYV32_04945 [Candidatus Kerfeldbacteria bacterium]|nr:hypothetical protein [Candidatus Kerfeldbacteria bacterium]
MIFLLGYDLLFGRLDSRVRHFSLEVLMPSKSRVLIIVGLVVAIIVGVIITFPMFELVATMIERIILKMGWVISPTMTQILAYILDIGIVSSTLVYLAVGIFPLRVKAATEN